MGGTESGHPYLDVASKPKNYGPQSYDKLKKEPRICQIFHLKKTEKVLMKVDKMADVFDLFCTTLLFYFSAPSSYTLNLKALKKASKVS